MKQIIRSLSRPGVKLHIVILTALSAFFTVYGSRSSDVADESTVRFRPEHRLAPLSAWNSLMTNVNTADDDDEIRLSSEHDDCASSRSLPARRRSRFDVNLGTDSTKLREIHFRHNLKDYSETSLAGYLQPDVASNRDAQLWAFVFVGSTSAVGLIVSAVVALVSVARRHRRRPPRSRSRSGDVLRPEIDDRRNPVCDGSVDSVRKNSLPSSATLDGDFDYARQASSGQRHTDWSQGISEHAVIPQPPRLAKLQWNGDLPSSQNQLHYPPAQCGYQYGMTTDDVISKGGFVSSCTSVSGSASVGDSYEMRDGDLSVSCRPTAITFKGAELNHTEPPGEDDWPSPSNSEPTVMSGTRSRSGNGSSTRQMATTASLLSVVVVAVVATSAAAMTGCHREPGPDDVVVRIVVRLSTTVQPDSVRIFFNQRYNNPPVEASRWIHRNKTSLTVFDLVDVPATDAAPCRVDRNCPVTLRHRSMTSAPLHDVATCDWSTEECVCRRGLSLVDGACVVGESTASTASSSSSSVVAVEASANTFLEDLETSRQLETTYYVTDAKQQTDFFWFRSSGVRVNIGLQNVDVIPIFDGVEYDGTDDSEFVVGDPSAKDEAEKYRAIVRRHCRHPLPDYYNLALEVSRLRTTAAVVKTCSRREYADSLCPSGVFAGDQYLQRTVNEACPEVSSSSPLEQLRPAANSFVCAGNADDLLKKVFNITPSATRPVELPSTDAACRQAKERCDHCLRNARCRHSDPIEQKCCQIDCYAQTDCRMTVSARCRRNRSSQCATGDSYRFTLQPVFTQLDRSFRCHLRRRRPDYLYRLWFYVSVPSAPSGFETPRRYGEVRPRMTDLSSPEHDTSLVSGKATVEFLDVEFDAAIDLPEEVVLTGRKSTSSEGGRWSHVVEPVVNDESRVTSPDKGDGGVHRLSESVYIAAVDFVEPFGYSSSTWVQDNQCSKNVSLFVRPKTTASSAGSMQIGSRTSADVTEGSVTDKMARSERDVSVSIVVISEDDEIVDSQQYQQSKSRGGSGRTSSGSSISDGHLRYLIKSVDKPPQIRITIPGNVSLLHWWFRDQHPALVTGSALRADVTANATHIRFYVEGYLTGYPGYVRVTINQIPSGRRLVRYDVLLSSPPPHFELTFHVLRQNDDGDSVNNNDRDDDDDDASLYECLLDDAKTVHRLLLALPSETSATQFFAPEATRGHFLAGIDHPGTERKSDPLDDMHARTALVVVVMATAAVSLRLCICGWSHDSTASGLPPLSVSATTTAMKTSEKRLRQCSRKPDHTAASRSTLPPSSRRNSNSYDPPAWHQLRLEAETQPHQKPPSSSLSSMAGVARFRLRTLPVSGIGYRSVIAVYFIWNILYSVGITLTVMSTVVRFVVNKHYARFDDVVNRIRSTSLVGDAMYHSPVSMIPSQHFHDAVNQFNRQVDNLKSVHDGTLLCLRDTASTVTADVIAQTQTLLQTTDTPAAQTPFPTNHESSFSQNLARYGRHFNDSTFAAASRLIQTEWRPSLDGYRKFTSSARVAENDWLLFPRSLYNASVNDATTVNVGVNKVSVPMKTSQTTNESSVGVLPVDNVGIYRRTDESYVVKFLTFLGVVEAEMVKLWPMAFLDRLEDFKRSTLKMLTTSASAQPAACPTTQQLSWFNQPSHSVEDNIRHATDQLISGLNSSGILHQLPSNRFFTAGNSYSSSFDQFDDDDDEPIDDVIVGCQIPAIEDDKKLSSGSDLRTSDGSFDIILNGSSVWNEEFVCMLFLFVDVLLVFNRWTCLYAILSSSTSCGRSNFQLSESGSGGNRVNGNGPLTQAGSGRRTPSAAPISAEFVCRPAVCRTGLLDATESADKKQLPSPDGSIAIQTCLPVVELHKKKKTSGCNGGAGTGGQGSIHNPTRCRRSQPKRHSTHHRSSRDSLPSLDAVGNTGGWQNCMGQATHSTALLSLPRQIRRSASADDADCTTRLLAVDDDGYRFSGFLFSRLTECAVGLTLVYVTLAALDGVLRDAYLSTTAGLTNTNGDSWRIGDKLHSVMLNQVTGIKQWYLSVTLSELAYTSNLLQSFNKGLDGSFSRSRASCQSSSSSSGSGGTCDVGGGSQDFRFRFDLKSVNTCSRRSQWRPAYTAQSVECSKSSHDLVQSQPYTAAYTAATDAMRQTLDFISTVWTSLLLLFAAVFAIQLVNAGISVLFARWHQRRRFCLQKKLTLKSELKLSLQSCATCPVHFHSGQQTEIAAVASLTNASLQAEQQNIRCARMRCRPELQESASERSTTPSMPTNQSVTTDTSFFASQGENTWSGNHLHQPLHHVRFASAIEVHPTTTQSLSRPSRVRRAQNSLSVAGSYQTAHYALRQTPTESKV